ncbi:hypothetical protein ABXU18_004401 [Escherichia coli]|nr:hypothetical protein [Escherichia coli]HAM4947301.1 hypothetical protein [Escherichia coli]HAM5463247.1 hypothetical protein [Escherichia coli]HCQ0416368.1 hypothetical protein [Escherichia coli]HEC4435377.1 hypothetical protein [Escherichia coli]
MCSSLPSAPGATNSLLENGYIDPNSVDDEADALEYLGELLVQDETCCLSFCKKILYTLTSRDGVIKGAALDFLLLSDDWQDAFDYLMNNSEMLSVQELKIAFFYFCCAKNETAPYPVPDGLFKKLRSQYKIIKNDSDLNSDVRFYGLHEIYDEFINSYQLND